MFSDFVMEYLAPLVGGVAAVAAVPAALGGKSSHISPALFVLLW